MKNEQNKKSRKSKQQYVDDGHTVYSMDNVPKPFYKVDKKEPLVSKKEKRAIVKAALATYLPIFLGVIASFALVIVLLYFWLM